MQKLIKEGYVFKQRIRKDMHSCYIFQTEKEKMIEFVMKQIAHKWEEILISGFDSNQRNFIVHSFDNMIENISKIMVK
jgi:DNA-binding MarR family transcriptional regulator